MSSSVSTTTAIDDRIKKSKLARALIKRTFITYKNISARKRLILLDALIGIVLLYSITSLNRPNTNLVEIQSFYSSCIRGVTEGVRLDTSTEKRNANLDIRTIHQIPPIKSKMRYLKITTFIKWEQALSIAYLNNVEEIDNALIRFPHRLH